MKKRKNKKGFLIGGIAAGAVVILAGGGILAWKLLINTATPQETVKNYFALVEKGQYDKMYAMLSERTRETVSEKEFTERNQNIYEGIEAKDIKISLSERECALKEGCIGQLPEIYDGKNPVSSKGCFAQAWSVGELLRVYEQIEKKKK